MIEDVDGASLFRASVDCELRTVWPSGLQLFRAFSLLGYAACYFASAFAQFKFFRLIKFLGLAALALARVLSRACAAVCAVCVCAWRGGGGAGVVGAVLWRGRGGLG